MKKALALVAFALALVVSATAKDRHPLTMTAVVTDGTGHVVETKYHIGDYNCNADDTSVNCYAPGHQVSIDSPETVVFTMADGTIIYTSNDHLGGGTCGAFGKTLYFDKDYNPLCALASQASTRLYDTCYPSGYADGSCKTHSLVVTFRYALGKTETVPAKGTFRAYTLQHINIEKVGEASYAVSGK